MSADIDIDFANRNDILNIIKHIPARKLHKGKPERHNSGVYVQPIPFDPMVGCSSLHFKEADERGYFKIDFLNMSVYQQIRDDAHYRELLNKEPPWERLSDPAFVKQIVHIANYPKQVADVMPDSIPRLAMFLAALRPGKKHLLGKPWNVMAKTIWDKVDDESPGYAFKCSHAISYSVLVGLHMNIISEQEKK
jgi:hypothetical protein